MNYKQYAILIIYTLLWAIWKAPNEYEEMIDRGVKLLNKYES